jgi:hypothetical protein
MVIDVFSNLFNILMNYFLGNKLNNKRHGKGKFFYGDGGVYDGDWENNKFLLFIMIECKGMEFYTIQVVNRHMKEIGNMINFRESN